MALRTRLALILVAAPLWPSPGPLTARQQPPERPRQARPDFDIREHRLPAQGSARARAELRQDGGFAQPPRLADGPAYRCAARARGARLDRRAHGAADWPCGTGWCSAVDRLGLDDGDLESLTVVRDYTSRSDGLRHVTFAQSFDGIPVFDGTVTVHIASNGEVVRVNSSAARGEGRQRTPTLAAEQAAAIASNDVDPGAFFVPARVGPSTRPEVARFARGRFRRDVTASLVWFAMDGGLRLAWHVELEPEGLPQFYDVLVDAETGELLLRRNRVLDGNGTGRVVQSAATQAIDPRRPDQMPTGSLRLPAPASITSCAISPRPSAIRRRVLSDTGRLAGNNVHVFRGERHDRRRARHVRRNALVVRLPIQLRRVGRDGALLLAELRARLLLRPRLRRGRRQLPGQQLRPRRRSAAIPSRASRARPAATTRRSCPRPTAPARSSACSCGTARAAGPRTSTATASPDIDGDFDTDIILHEFHHGVSHRLEHRLHRQRGRTPLARAAATSSPTRSTAIRRSPSIAYPGGLRTVNGKTYNDWTCLLGLFCEPHDNGEIWANVLWDVRERFRVDLVRGSEAAAINEVHQLYIDALKLSPPGADDAGPQGRDAASRRASAILARRDSAQLLRLVGIVRRARHGRQRAGIPPIKASTRSSANFEVPPGATRLRGRRPSRSRSPRPPPPRRARRTASSLSAANGIGDATIVVNFRSPARRAAAPTTSRCQPTATIPAGALRSTSRSYRLTTRSSRATRRSF